jgi:hypothetical protein
VTDRWDLRIAYERRLGSVLVAPVPPGSRDPVTHFRLPVSTILRGLGITDEALGLMQTDAARPTVDAPGADVEELCRAAVPADCTGLTVLDVGGYDGRMAALALERGAKAAVCLDSAQWTHYGWEQAPPHPGVEYVRGDVMEWTAPFDVVLLFNVIYHTPNPWAMLAHLRTFTRRTMALCSLVTWTERPVWELYEPYEVNPDDDTVYWGPSESGLRRLLDLTGWKDVQMVGKSFERLVLTCKP